MSRRTRTARGLLLLVAAFVAGCSGRLSETRSAGPTELFAPEVVEVSLTVSRLDEVGPPLAEVVGSGLTSAREAEGAALDALVNLRDARVRQRRLAIGEERIALIEYERPRGRPGRANLKSNDLDFQHLALVVRDIDRAFERITGRGFVPISDGGVQTIPHSNTAAGGIRAVYFRDGDGHALELIWYPEGKGDRRWQVEGGGLFLGIDHTAIAVRDTQRSLAFYQSLIGLKVAGTSLNEGIEQERLSGVRGARVRITGLRGISGPGVELLEYLAPGPGRSSRKDRGPNDFDYYETTIRVNRLELLLERLDAVGVEFISREPSPCVICEGRGLAAIVRDPDGHAVRLVARGEE